MNIWLIHSCSSRISTNSSCSYRVRRFYRYLQYLVKSLIKTIAKFTEIAYHFDYCFSGVWNHKFHTTSISREQTSRKVCISAPHFSSSSIPSHECLRNSGAVLVSSGTHAIINLNIKSQSDPKIPILFNIYTVNDKPWLWHYYGKTPVEDHVFYSLIPSGRWVEDETMLTVESEKYIEYH